MPKKDLAPGVDCLPGGIGDGFLFRYDGNWMVLDDFPTTGGPWVPAVYPNGQIAWYNVGG